VLDIFKLDVKDALVLIGTLLEILSCNSFILFLTDILLQIISFTEKILVAVKHPLVIKLFATYKSELIEVKPFNILLEETLNIEFIVVGPFNILKEEIFIMLVIVKLFNILEDETINDELTVVNPFNKLLEDTHNEDLIVILFVPFNILDEEIYKVLIDIGLLKIV